MNNKTRRRNQLNFDLTFSYGAKRLAIEMIRQARNDLQRPFSFHYSECVHRSALKWICSKDEMWPLSFINCCHAWHIEPSIVRRELLAISRAFRLSLTH